LYKRLTGRARKGAIETLEHDHTEDDDSNND